MALLGLPLRIHNTMVDGAVLVVKTIRKGHQTGIGHRPSVTPGHHVLEAPNVKCEVHTLGREQQRISLQHLFKS